MKFGATTQPPPSIRVTNISFVFSLRIFDNLFNCWVCFLIFLNYRATQNSTHVSISTNLNACGTLVNETEDALIFWNEIRVDAVIIGNVITRTHDINLRFHCSYSRKKMLSVQFQTQQVYIGSEGALINQLFLFFIHSDRDIEQVVLT